MLGEDAKEAMLVAALKGTQPQQPRDGAHLPADGGGGGAMTSSGGNGGGAGGETASTNGHGGGGAGRRLFKGVYSQEQWEASSRNWERRCRDFKAKSLAEFLQRVGRMNREEGDRLLAQLQARHGT